MDFFCDVVLWFMLLIGLILMLLPSSLFASIAQMDDRVPGLAEYTGERCWRQPAPWESCSCRDGEIRIRR